MLRVFPACIRCYVFVAVLAVSFQYGQVVYVFCI